MDKVYQRKNWALAWQRVKRNKGAGGIDGQTLDEFEEHLDAHLDRLHEELKNDAYCPLPVRQKLIPKAGQPGKFRPLGIPAIYDRVCQQALQNRLEPIFEAVFDDASFGYRPGRSTFGVSRTSAAETRRGDFTIHRKTSRKEFQAKWADLKEKRSRNHHADPATVGQWLQSVYRGWCPYYPVPGNYPRLQQFRGAIQDMWLRTLRRRSQRGRRLTWSTFWKLSRRWLPTPTILHPYPDVRFAGQHPRQEPYAVVPHERICARGGQQ